MSHLNCLRTMPEITDEAVIEAPGLNPNSRSLSRYA